MRLATVGDVEILRVVEIEGPCYPLHDLLPDADPEAVERERAWLAPHFVAPSGLLIAAFQSFVLRIPRCTVVVDTCIGNDKDRPELPDWHRRGGGYLDDLRRLGISPEQVDVVLCTHLHPDHVGWNTRLEDGRWVPTFPNATYLFARTEYEFWLNEKPTRPDEVDRLNRAAFEDSVLPVVAAGRARLVEMDHEIEDGIWLEPAAGHTPGTVILNIRRGGSEALLLGDTLHHPLQVRHPEWSSRFCHRADLSRAVRFEIMERCAASGARILPAHFPTPVIGRVADADGRWWFEV